MKKSHTCVLNAAAGVIKEDWWRQVIPPWLQATEVKSRDTAKSKKCSTLSPFLPLSVALFSHHDARWHLPPGSITYPLPIFSLSNRLGAALPSQQQEAPMDLWIDLNRYLCVETRAAIYNNIKHDSWYHRSVFLLVALTETHHLLYVLFASKWGSNILRGMCRCSWSYFCVTLP